MPKFLLLFAVLVIEFSLMGFSQVKPRDYFSAGAGVTIPLGTFNKKDIDDGKSGFAQSRSIITISYEHKFKESRLGYVVNVTSLKNGFHGGWLFDRFKDSLPKIIVDTRPWSAVMIMPGIFYSIPLNDGVSIFHINGMMGISEATSYGYMVRGNDFSKIQRHQVKDSGLSYAFGFDFRTEIFDIEGLNLLCSSSYVSSSHDFKDVKTTDSRNDDILTSFKQRFENLTISLGISLEF